MSPRTRTRAPKKTTPAPSPARVRKPARIVWEAALDLADGDARRLTVEPGGSVLVR